MKKYPVVSVVVARVLCSQYTFAKGSGTRLPSSFCSMTMPRTDISWLYPDAIQLNKSKQHAPKRFASLMLLCSTIILAACWEIGVSFWVSFCKLRSVTCFSEGLRYFQLIHFRCPY